MSEPAIRRNILWNLAGIVLPMLAGLLVVPILVRQLGVERFGLVSIAWMLVGYFGVLDLGLGRALTRAVAHLRGRNATASDQAALAHRATLTMLGVGLFWMILLLALADWLVQRGFKTPPALQEETLDGFYWLAVSVPGVLFANARMALLEGQQRFHIANAIKIPMGVLTMLAPMLVSLRWPRLDAVLGAIALVRILAALLLAGLRFWPAGVMHRTAIASADLRELFRFGGWLTVTNLVGPLVTYFDRFYLAVVLSTTAVTFYTVPYDVLIRLTALPIALLAVLFPLMAELRVVNAARLEQLLRQSLRLLLLTWWPLIALAVLLAREALQHWVGPAFLGDSLSVWQCLAIGVFINGCAFVPYNLIQSAGRADVTAKFHLLELPVYVVLLIVAVAMQGIKGAAIAWTLRALLDALLLYSAAAIMNKPLASRLWSSLGTMLGGVLLLGVCAWIEPLALRLSLAVGMVVIGLVGTWMTFSRWRHLEST